MVEVYDRTGKRHRDEFDPASGKRVGPPVPAGVSSLEEQAAEETRAGFRATGLRPRTEELKIEFGRLVAVTAVKVTVGRATSEPSAFAKPSEKVSACRA